MAVRRILNDEQYQKSEAMLLELADEMHDPLLEDNEKERLRQKHIYVSNCMGDYMIAKECREEQVRSRYIDQGVTTEEWLQEYWAAMDGKPVTAPNDTEPVETERHKPELPAQPDPESKQQTTSSFWDLMDDE